MTRTTKWLVGAIGALAVAGGVVVVGFGGPVWAQARSSGWTPGLMAGHMTGDMAAMHQSMAGMHESMTGDMAAMHESMAGMHEAMSGLMAEMPAMHEEMLSALAARLDLTADELERRLADGETLAALASERGIAPDALKADLVAFMQQTITDLVQAGKLDAQTAAQVRGLVAQHAEICLTANMADMQGMMGMMGMMVGPGTR